MTAQSVDRTAWHEERRTGIGGSDAAVVLGLSPYKTAEQLRLEKRGEVEPENLDSVERVQWGIRLEDAIAEEYAQRTGRTIHRVNRMMRHPNYDFMLANLDRRVVGERVGLECKNVNLDSFRFSDSWGEPGTDQVPENYALQCQHYMGVTGWKSWDLAALIGGNDLKIYTIKRDDDLLAMMLERYHEFWQAVVDNVQLPVQSVEEARARYPISQAKTIEATDEIANACKEIALAKATVKTAETYLDSLQPQVLGFLGEHDTLAYNGVILATWKSSKPSIRFDKDKLAKDHPEIIEAYSSEVPGSRRFLIK